MHAAPRETKLTLFTSSASARKIRSKLTFPFSSRTRTARGMAASAMSHWGSRALYFQTIAQDQFLRCRAACLCRAEIVHADLAAALQLLNFSRLTTSYS